MSLAPVVRPAREIEALVRDNWGLPKWAIGRFVCRPTRERHWDVLYSAAAQALWRAACTYDEAQGSFSNYATLGIRKALLRELERLRTQRARFQRARSLDKVRDDGTTLGEKLPDRRDDAPTWAALVEERDHKVAQVRHALTQLPERLQDVLLRHAEGEHLAEIGARLGVTRQRVHQAYAKGLDLLRRALAEEVEGGHPCRGVPGGL